MFFWENISTHRPNRCKKRPRGNENFYVQKYLKNQFSIPSIDRKILETGGADWKSAPEKKFPGCGLIKINNEIVIRDADQTPTVEKLGPVENWSCNNKEITVQYGEPAKDLKIKLTYDNGKAAGQYSNWTFTVTTNDKTYTPSIAVPFTQLSDKKRMFNFSQSYLSLKVACIY